MRVGGVMGDQIAINIRISVVSKTHNSNKDIAGEHIKL